MATKRFISSRTAIFLMDLRELVKSVDKDIGRDKDALVYRARSIAAELLEPYLLFHTKIVVQLVRTLGGDRIDTAAAWLHDIGRVVSGKGHREIGEAWAREWLKAFELTEEERYRILDGIKNHGSKCVPTTETGMRLKLADALAMFDEGWAYMVATYFKETGRSQEGVNEFRKKWAVVEEMGTAKQKERCNQVLEKVLSMLRE